jgi:hypothetical protein
MSANVAIAPNYNVSVSDDNDDGFSQPEAKRGGMIEGRMLRFKNDDFAIDKGSEYLPEGTKLAAVSTAMGWVRWAEKKPETRITEKGQEHPYRRDLGDEDKSKWEKGLNGDKVDPWRDTRWLRLINPVNAERFTFTTDTNGGRIAFGELKEQIRLYRMANPGAVPVVIPACTDMPTNYGIRKRPKFEVVDWIVPQRQEEPKPALAKNSDLNDEIGF